MNSDIAIRVENLSKKYFLHHCIKNKNGVEINEISALKDISFEIKKGESVGIIGANGSGKSTLLKILAGITPPTTGRVEINGKVASILDIGSGFHPELSGRDNVYLNGQLLGFKKKEIKKKFDEIVEFSGIQQFIDEPVKSYSNGMYLRLAFSIMAHLEFEIYLFDEVFSVGDAKFAIKAKNKLNELINSGHKTILYVSHNINELYNQSLFILIDSGELIKTTNKVNILSDYLGQANANVTITNNIELIDFSKYPCSEDIKLNKVKLYQSDNSNNSFFRTDKSFIIEIEYEKLKNIDTIDVILNITNIQGFPLFTSSPFIAGDFSNNTINNTYNIACTIPPNFFNSQLYVLSVFFIKNGSRAILHHINNSSVNDLYENNKTVEIVLKLNDIITFKTVYYKNNQIVDLSNLNLQGHLLLGGGWKEKMLY